MKSCYRSMFSAAATLALVAATGAAWSAERASRKEGLQAFTTIQEVLQHPRCQNCHIPGDAPLQFDDGRTHAQHVLRGPDGKGVAGLHCSTCHGAANLPASYDAVSPPGAPNWHLPPEHQKMVFKDLPAAQLCAVVKDPASNGGKNMDQLLEHVSHDKLVLWGWAPGGRRAPVPIPHDKFVAAFEIWMKAGAPCPKEGSKS
jgi:hypothetical protein